MVYLILFIALLALTIKGYCGKRVSGYVRNMGDSFIMNTIRFIICIFIGLALVLFEAASLKVDGLMLAICALAGITSSISIGAWVLAVKSHAMATIDVTSTLASIIPAILCAVFFGEAFSGMKMIGFGFIVAASVLMLGFNKSRERKQGGILGNVCLILTALGEAFSSFAQQLYKQYCAEGGLYTANRPTYSKTVYNFYIYVFSAITLAVFFLIYLIVSRNKKELTARSLAINTAKALPFTSIMAVCLFAAIFLQTVAANDFNMPSQVLYPIIKGGGLVGMLVIGAMFFGEKFNKKSLIGTSLALVGIVLINIL